MQSLLRSALQSCASFKQLSYIFLASQNCPLRVACTSISCPVGLLGAGMSPSRSRTRSKHARTSEDQADSGAEDRAATPAKKAAQRKPPRKKAKAAPEDDDDAAAAAAAAAAPAAAPAKKATPKKMKPLVLTNSVEISLELQSKAMAIAEQLNGLYPDPPIPLNHETPFQLLVAVMLSAQTTDVKVNQVTPALFARAPEAASLAAMEASEVEGYIKVLGLAPTKAKNLVAMSKMLVEKHSGAVPDTFEGLEALPGVGHKTASVVMAQVHNMAAFPVDTHIHRLAQRWGLTQGQSVEQTEADLKALLPQERWRDAHLQIIYFGREHCPAQRHDPTGCLICSWAAVPPYHKLGQSPPRPGKKLATVPQGKKIK